MEDQPPKPIKELIWFSLISTSIKLLLLPSYHSTDFEVHRNWLAITNSHPLSQWYSDTTSPWTLDYPPFFAYFELFLSLFAAKIDPTIVNLHKGLNYKADSVVYFQRITVIVSDLVLHYAIYRITRKLDSTKRRLIWVLVIWSPALFIVDHMHFQYNGFLLGLLLVSISALMEGRDLMGGFFFAVLLCFKHLFAVAAPVYFVYLLRHYCRGGLIKGFGRFLMMGLAVVVVFAAAFGPFVYHDQMLQVIHRMFPFGRGLCHAFWAPNFWVFYIMADKLLAFFLRSMGFNVQRPTGSFTSGLVGDSSPFAVLPQITPLMTFMMVLLAISPCLFKAWKNPRPRKIARWIAYAYSCGFVFGWHVHEKAMLHFLIPLAINAVDSINDACHYLLISIVSCYSLFPLLFEAREYPIKVTLLLLHCILMWFGFSIFSEVTTTNSKKDLQKKNDELRTEENLGISEKGGFGIGWIYKSYLIGIVAVEIWGQFLHPYILGNKLPFLPLMLVSVYSALGIMYSWIWQLKWIILYS
ncbi:probable dolichyl pyrophosphate Glc1Man9GlcNAc2 alpha-1,3-glucosyltransferase [Chenopodium quinoa]|nr:probable dolichyl pyrophosphate Glc1Man9GlcNAc2 alpha-1,3-glucosyltransferase [Chenopodium quinoa]